MRLIFNHGIDWRHTLARWIVLLLFVAPVIVPLEIALLIIVLPAHAIEWAVRGPRFDEKSGLISAWYDTWEWNKKVCKPFRYVEE